MIGSEFDFPICELSPYEIFDDKITVLDIDFFNPKPNESKSTKTLVSPANALRSYISGWYKTLRNLALVALLSILVYIGIRIILSSVASDKAKYKQMLLDWAVAVCLLFIMHYLMSFSVYIVKQVTDMVDSIQVNTKAKNEVQAQFKDSKIGECVHVFLLDGTSDSDMKKTVKNAYKTMAKKGDQKIVFADLFYTDGSLKNKATDENSANVLVWPASNFMEEARINYQLYRQDGSENTAMYGYGLIYVILVIYTIIFLFTYMKRVVYMAFLTVIAPLVAVTYPIDKLNDGKAQAFNMWFREYLFNLLIQPLHLLLYSLLIGAAMSFATENLVYVIMALGFLVPAEKMLRRFFGFEKAQTPGIFGGAAGAALMFNGLQRIMHTRPPKRFLGHGNGRNKNTKNEEDGKVPRTQKIDETKGFLGNGDDSQDGKVSDRLGDVGDDNTQNDEKDKLTSSGKEEAEETEKNATTQKDYDTYNQDLKDLENPAYRRWINGQNSINNLSNKRNRSTGNRLSRRARIGKGIRRTLGGYRTGLHNRYVAGKARNGGALRRGIRLAGGLAGAATATAAAGIIGITSGDLSKAGQYMATGAVGGYKLGSGIGDKAHSTVKDQKDMIKNALEEGKKGYYGNDYGKKQQEKYLREFKKNEENLRALEDKLNVNREKAEEIMETHAQDYINNDITDMDEFAAVYNLEHTEKMGRGKAIATRHYAMDRLGGKTVKNIDPEEKEKYDKMFNKEFVKNGRSEKQANKDVKDLYNAINKFHNYRK